MNEFGYGPRIYSDRGLWWVRGPEGPVPYADGLTIHADGRIEGIGEDPKAALKLRRRFSSMPNPTSRR